MNRTHMKSATNDLLEALLLYRSETNDERFGERMQAVEQAQAQFSLAVSATSVRELLEALERAERELSAYMDAVTVSVATTGQGEATTGVRRKTHPEQITEMQRSRFHPVESADCWDDDCECKK